MAVMATKGHAMRPTPVSRFVCFALLVLSGWATSPLLADPSVGEPKRGNAKFFRRHAENLERAAAGPAEVVFLGDSITEGWRKFPKIWEEAWGRYNPANFGIGGDRTQHVIWRIEQGEFDKLSPRVVVLMIGTNNTAADSGEAIAAGVIRIVELLHDNLPETKILLLAVFPRGPRINGRGVQEDWEAKMAKIDVVNTALAQLEDGDHVRFLDIGPKLMTADGQITRTVMPDQLHLSAAGYQIWAEFMAPLLAEMLSDDMQPNGHNADQG
jgi:beta-glucosidase